MSELNPALAAFNAGRFDEARKLLTRLLQKSGGNPDALYLLADTEQTSQNHETALALYERLLASRPEHGWAHYNKALLLSGSGRHAEAMPHHDQAVRLVPDNFWAYVNRANSKAALEEFEAAIRDYDQALRLNPRVPDALTNKGNALSGQGLYPQALACLDEALKLNPRHTPALLSRSAILTKLRQYDEAIASADQALQQQPKHPEAWLRKASAQLEQEKFEEALQNSLHAIELQTHHAEAWAVRGDALSGLNQHAEALACYDRCLELKPDFVSGLRNKAAALKDLGQLEAAQTCLERAAELMPHNADVQVNLAQLLLRRQNYVSGWLKYEYRWLSQENTPKSLHTDRPRWQGGHVSDTLLIWGEQGIGDQILYSSMLPGIAAQNGRKVVALDKRLLPLFHRSMPRLEFADLSKADEMTDFTEQIALGSLGSIFRLKQDDFGHAQHPYLQADIDRTKTLRKQIGRNGRLVCGISWRSTRQRIGASKSLDLSAVTSMLAGLPLHLVNLQYGDTAAERLATQEQQGTEIQNVDEVDNFNDMDGLASLIQACDIVITTSNTTAHLAGALGKETLLLLPSGQGRLWYWMERYGHSLWYPSIRLFAQPSPGAWPPALRALKAYLEKKAWN